MSKTLEIFVNMMMYQSLIRAMWVWNPQFDPCYKKLAIFTDFPSSLITRAQSNVIPRPFPHWNPISSKKVLFFIFVIGLKENVLKILYIFLAEKYLYNIFYKFLVIIRKRFENSKIFPKICSKYFNVIYAKCVYIHVEHNRR